MNTSVKSWDLNAPRLFGVISLEINIVPHLCCAIVLPRKDLASSISFSESYNLGLLCLLPIIDLQLYALWSIFPTGFI